jgi:proteasome beta subunit
MDDNKQTKTGTTTIGLMCKDGIVLAADKRATAGYFVASKKVDKILKISDNIAVTIAGTVSDIQLLTKIIKAEIRLKEFRTGKITTVKEAVNLLSGMVYNNIRNFSMIPGISHFVVGGKDIMGFHLYDLSPDGCVEEIQEYVSSGSGSELVYGLLESSYQAGLTVKEGAELAERCINTSIARDIASGNGMDIFTITEKGIQKVTTKKVDMKLK